MYASSPVIQPVGMRAKVIGLVRRLFYACGIFSVWHALRNRHSLTVFMFHRVLPATSEAYARADKEFTFTVDGFARTLQFIKRHYALIDMQQLQAAQAGQIKLPSLAALITFDDGWLDTVTEAYPLLKQQNVPATVFIATELLEQPSARWWQDALVEVMTNAEQTKSLAADLDVPVDTPKLAWHLSATLAGMSQEQRSQLLEPYVQAGHLDRQMVTAADLQTLDKKVLALGAHGHTHAPLTESAAAGDELRQSFAIINAVGGEHCMAFPHGSCNADLISKARKVGFESIFTSQATLNDARELGDTLGRLHIPENQWTCEDQKISFPLLATYLFFRPIERTSRTPI